MAVYVSPQAFTLVFYDAAEIARVAGQVAAAIGLSGDLSIAIDETSPLARIRAKSDGDAWVVTADSGAFEDTKMPRQFSADATALALGRVLLRAKDRVDGGFGEAPADDDLTLAQSAAWDVYAIGRVHRLGYPINEQRWRYNYRNRHGFTDVTDETFDDVLNATGLTWGQLDAISQKGITNTTTV